MWDLTSLDLTNLVPVAVLGASLLGSAHCAGMCGGLSISQSGSIKKQIGYQFGRLFGYVMLGLLAGAVGARIYSPTSVVWISWVATSLMGITFFALAVKAWKGSTPHLFRLPARWFSVLSRRRGGAFSMGLLTAALPCGWLHTFILAAVATQSLVKGGLVMFLFWLGTLPVLLALPFVSRTAWRLFPVRTPRIAAILLVFAGVGSFAVRIYHAPFSAGSGSTHTLPSCH